MSPLVPRSAVRLLVAAAAGTAALVLVREASNGSAPAAVQLLGYAVGVVAGSGALDVLLRARGERVLRPLALVLGAGALAYGLLEAATASLACSSLDCDGLGPAYVGAGLLLAATGVLALAVGWVRPRA